jgi:hypothetical protein
MNRAFISQKTTFFIVTAMKISNLIYQTLFTERKEQLGRELEKIKLNE